MTNKVFKLFSFLAFFILTISCANDNDNYNADLEPKLELKTKGLSHQNLLLIGNNLKRYKTQSSIAKNGVANIEENYELILEPLVENGRELHTEMIAFLQEDIEFQNLSALEKEALLHLDDTQLAELSFVYSQTYELNERRMSMDPRIRNCVSTAIGIGAIRDLILNSAALGTVGTTVGAIKLIGRRYLGWIGVAWMVMDFVDCMDSF